MKSSILALVGGASTALAGAVRGFNYASQGVDLNGFTSQFQMAASLAGASDFTSARLYTMIQDGTTNSPISAIQAAINTKTTLLLGMWASVDNATFQNEIIALNSALSQYGSSFTDLVVGISVGSEDLYRISPTGIAADEGVGQSPDVLVDYISQVRAVIKGTPLESAPVGHVDTWNVYVNSSNSEVISACDWLGLDEYPYYQKTDVNTIGNAASLFFQAYDKVQAVAGGKPIWVTESGWPTTGPTTGQAVASVDNAETYWQEVACQLEKQGTDFWWYILQDAGASPSFGVSENGTPLYNLACNSTSGYSGSSSSSGSMNSSSTSASGNSSSSSSSSTATVAASSGHASTTGSHPSGTSSGTGSTQSPFHGSASRVTGSAATLFMGAVFAALFL